MPHDWNQDPVADLHTRLSIVEEKIPSFVTQDEFKPIRLFVYGFMSLVMLTVLGYVLSRTFGK